MNHLGHVKAWQGQYDPLMASVGTTSLAFDVPNSGYVMVMAQATALGAVDTNGSRVGVLFKLYDHNDAEVGQATGYVKGLHPGHGTVCLTYLAPARLDPGTPAKITIEAAPTTPPGTITAEDYFSVSVVELEQSADIAHLTGPKDAGAKAN